MNKRKTKTPVVTATLIGLTFLFSFSAGGAPLRILFAGNSFISPGPGAIGSAPERRPMNISMRLAEFDGYETPTYSKHTGASADTTDQVLGRNPATDMIGLPNSGYLDSRWDAFVMMPGVQEQSSREGVNTMDSRLYDNNVTAFKENWKTIADWLINDNSPNCKLYLFESYARPPGDGDYHPTNGEFIDPADQQGDYTRTQHDTRDILNGIYGDGTATCIEIGSAFEYFSWRADVNDGLYRYDVGTGKYNMHAALRGELLNGMMIYAAVYQDAVSDIYAKNSDLYSAYNPSTGLLVSGSNGVNDVDDLIACLNAVKYAAYKAGDQEDTTDDITLDDWNTLAAAVDETVFGDVYAPVRMIVSSTSVSVQEGGTAAFNVRLSKQPSNTVVVSVTKDWGDGDITLTGGSSLTFTTNNWGANQVVMLSAAEDEDTISGVAEFSCDASGDITTITIQALEADNDSSGEICREGFNYTEEDGILNTHQGGIGWSSAWSDTGGGQTDIQTNGLSYSTLNVQSGCAVMRKNDDAAQEISRVIDTSKSAALLENDKFGKDDTTVWLSFLIQVADAGGLVSGRDGITLRNGTADEICFGRDGASRKRGIGDSRSGTYQNAPEDSYESVVFMVVRIDFKSGNEDVYLWTDPSLDAEPSTLSPDATWHNNFDFQFDNIEIWAESAPDNASVLIDEIRLSESWDGVIGLGGMVEEDTDLDGLPDTWEEQYYGDKDNIDGTAMASNGVNTVRDAYIAGLNPTNSESVFEMESFDGSSFQWNAVSGRVYSVWWATNLIDGFSLVASNLPWTQGSYADSSHAACGFYKIDVQLEQ